MKKKYALKEFYELERKIFELRISVKKGNFSNELREKLTTLEIEYERISSQISWDIENCNIDYGYEDNNKELKLHDILKIFFSTPLPEFLYHYLIVVH